MRIFLDLDGVITDLIKSIMIKYNIKKWPKGNYGIASILNISEQALWRSLTVDFWANLDFTSEGRDLLFNLAAYDTFFVTTPVPVSKSIHGSIQSIVGKYLWLNKYARSWMTQEKVIFTLRKKLLAKENHVLIDDNNRNCRMFTKAGGHSILFPQIWNNNINFIDNKLDYVMSEIERIKKIIVLGSN